MGDAGRVINASWFLATSLLPEAGVQLLRFTRGFIRQNAEGLSSRVMHSKKQAELIVIS